MKIKEIVIESRVQLDEGMLDSIKSKVSSYYNQYLKQNPEFAKIMATVKTHKNEVDAIAKQLKAKADSGQRIDKEDIIASVTPLSRKIAGEVGSVNEEISDYDEKHGSKVQHGINGAIIGAITGFIFSGLLRAFNGDVSMTAVAFIASLLGILIGIVIYDDNKSYYADQEELRKADQDRYNSLSPEQKRKENLQNEYNSLEYSYQYRRHEMSYAETRRLRELYDQGFR
jgi:TM2 domain-containing membrane protein YozV